MSRDPRALAHGLPSAEPHEVGLDADRLRAQGQRWRAEVERGRLPGAVWLVMRQGRVAWVDALGQLAPAADAGSPPGDAADELPARQGAPGVGGHAAAAAPASRAPAGTPMPADALFRIYSMTKPIVSVAVMQLVERGALLLSDAVSAWLPEFAGAQVAVEQGGEVRFEPVQREATVQDLLRHTAGLTYEFLGDAHVHRRYQQARIASRGRSNAEFCRVLAGLPLAHQPGAVWDYSRATDVAGRLVEVVSGQPLGTYLREHILAPLGMHETGFVAPDGQHHRIAEPFALDPDDGTPVHLLDPRKAPLMESGGGGLVSSIADYARFTAMLAAGGTLGDTRILGRASLALMTADHLGDLPSACPLLTPGYGFGLGFAVRTHAGLASTPGSVGTYHWSGIAGTFFFVDPGEQLAAILLTQAPGRRDPYRLMFRNLVYAALRD